MSEGQRLGDDSPGPPPWRALPAVDAVLRHLEGVPGAAAAVREELGGLRRALAAGEPGVTLPTPAALAERVQLRLRQGAAEAYPRVVNATGVVLHTGLGRAPLSPAAVEALMRAGDGYARLEVDAERGERQHREQALLEDLRALTGAPSATVVNNNAGALLLALTALASGRDVLVSRGELIEIGGGFRLPELLAQSGARLVEVGTTNRTYARDYAAVLRWETGLLLSMHTSNFRIVGFQHRPERAELVALAREAGVPLLEDIGSGLLQPQAGELATEPDARTALAAGVDLLCFSGDKLLGGPQAGLLLGREDLVARCRSHPLFRALRPDRLTLTALAATLQLHRRAPDEVPVLAALRRSAAARGEHARALLARLSSSCPGAHCELTPSEASAGSGSLPGRPLASFAVDVSVPGLEAEVLARRLRQGQPVVHARVWQGRVRLDVAALLPGDEQRLAEALARALSPRAAAGPEGEA